MNIQTPMVPGLLGEKEPQIVSFLRHETGKDAPGHRILKNYASRYLQPYNLEQFRAYPQIESAFRTVCKLEAYAYLLDHLPTLPHDMAYAKRTNVVATTDKPKLAVVEGKPYVMPTSLRLREYIENHHAGCRPMMRRVDDLAMTYRKALYLLIIKKARADGKLEDVVNNPPQILAILNDEKKLDAALKEPLQHARDMMHSLIHVSMSLGDAPVLPEGHPHYDISQRCHRFSKETVLPAVAGLLPGLLLDLQHLPDISRALAETKRPQRPYIVSGEGKKAKLIEFKPRGRNPD